ncbi:DUF2207 family protein [Phytohabitans sp. LJ34]|uniref:DUF2207 family protein n=1 Tax=Phytohabitans sp. LJ34 TaxID=3452217 RepID=UPI003F8B9A4F
MPSTLTNLMEDLAWVGQLKLALLGVAPLGYLVMLGWFVAGRPWLPRPSAATPELGPEPPALVAMMYNRWRVGDTAIVATLLDLAARRFVELDQVGGETVFRPRDAASGQLTTSERAVLSWFTSRTVANRGVGMAALRPANAAEARAFRRRYARMVRAEAEERGLSTRKPREMVEFSLFLFAMVSAATIVLPGTYLLLPDWRWWLVAPIAFFALFILLIVPTGAPIALRDWSTPDGRGSLSRWLGVKAYLDATPQLQALPPAAVTLWGRYLAYAAALGSAPVATRTLAAIWTGQAAPAAHAAAAAALDSPPIPPPERHPDLRLGGIAVFGGEVVTPAGTLRRSQARWNVSHTGAVRPRLDSAMIVLVLAFMCMFPLNLLYLLFALERRYAGTVEVTVAGPSFGYTTRIPFDGDEQYTALRRELGRADDLLGTKLAPQVKELGSPPS